MVSLASTLTAGLTLGAFLLLPTSIRAQEPSDESLTLTTRFEKAVSADEPIELRLNRPLAPATGRLAVLIGHTDWTGLLQPTERGAVLQPAAIRLPMGEHELEVFLVSPANGWTSLGRYQLRVVASTARHTQVDPTFELANKGQIAAGHGPTTSAPARATFQDFGLNGAIGATVAQGGWTAKMEMSVLGVSNRGEALRVRERPDTAPLVDLAQYLVSVESDRISLSLGHVTFGTHPHLFNRFASRGALAAVRIGSRADVALSALHGSSIVGWDHPSGLDRREHRVVGATVGLEMLPRRAGGLRLELSLMDGRLLPLTGFNEGRIDEAARSRGGALRVLASDTGRRFRLDGGYATSTFVNPNEALRAQGSTAAPLREASRDARYLDVGYAVLQEKPVGRARANLAVAYRHERIDPQYGSVMADLKPDLDQNALDVRGSLGAATVQVAYTHARDNLEEIPALVSTLTRATQVNVAAPLASFLAAGADSGDSLGWRLWPILTYSLNRIHQRGARALVNPGEAESRRADQIATSQVIGLDWHLDRLRLGYRVDRSSHDNRQSAGEAADLANLVQSITADLSAGPRVDLQIAVGFERARNSNPARLDLTRRIGLNGIWRVAARTVLTGLVSSTALEDGGGTSDAGDVDVSVELSRTVAMRGLERHAQLFVRYSRQAGHRLDRVFALDDRRQRWALTTGFNVTLF